MCTRKLYYTQNSIQSYPLTMKFHMYYICTEYYGHSRLRMEIRFEAKAVKMRPVHFQG